MPNDLSTTLVADVLDLDSAAELLADNVLDLRLPKRSDADYEIEAISKGLAIVEILVEEQPITEKAIVAKSLQSRDVVLRTMRTLRIRGYAVRDDRTLEWRVGPRLERLAADIRS